MNAAQVLLQIDVDARGKPLAIQVLKSSAKNFERAARACALRQAFVSARDEAGTAIPGTTSPILVDFSR